MKMKKKKESSSKKDFKLDARLDSMFDFIEKMLKYEGNIPDIIERLRYQTLIFSNLTEAIMYSQRDLSTYKGDTLEKMINSVLKKLTVSFREIKGAVEHDNYSKMLLGNIEIKNIMYREKILDNVYDYVEPDYLSIMMAFHSDGLNLNDKERYYHKFSYPKIYIMQNLTSMDKQEPYVEFIPTGDCRMVVDCNMIDLYDAVKKVKLPRENKPGIADIRAGIHDMRFFQNNYTREKLFKTTDVSLEDIVDELILPLCQEQEESAQLEEISMTAYRLGKNNPLIDALIVAANHGIKVNLFMELTARGEIDNALEYIQYIKNNVPIELRKNFELVIKYHDVKVHSKMILMKMRNPKTDEHYGISIFSTGNFNPQTFSTYMDYIYISNNPSVTRLFEYNFNVLLNSTQSIHSSISSCILNEIYREIMKGEQGRIWIQVNHLDNEMIVKALKEAQKRGCDVKLLIRSTKGFHKKQLKCRTYIGDKLIHGRLFIFGRKNERRVYISSSDLMKRNLFDRFETYVKIENESLQKELMKDFSNKFVDSKK